MSIENIQTQVRAVIAELLDAHPLKKGAVLVIGCSSSEVGGGFLGHDSNEELGRAVFAAAHAECRTRGVFLAAQCCEHLNRALVVEEACADAYNLEPVCVVPWLKGGGSFATAAYHGFERPVVVEHIRASAGIDIGGTLIGMHLKDVAVPFRPQVRTVGKAGVTAAWCRPKLIGGERARYQ